MLYLQFFGGMRCLLLPFIPGLFHLCNEAQTSRRRSFWGFLLEKLA